MSLAYGHSNRRGQHRPVWDKDADILYVGVTRLVHRVSKWLVAAANAYAEARLQRALIELQLYHNHYFHNSKNDDDLPVIR